MGSRPLERKVNGLNYQLPIELTASLRRLDVGEVVATISDSGPIEIGASGRDVDPVGLIPLREVFSWLGSGAKDGNGEKYGYEKLEVE